MRKKSDKIKPGPGNNRLLLHTALICLVVLALYSRVTRNTYIDLDDTTLVVNNYPFLSDFSNISQVFRQGVFKVYNKPDTETSYYRPVMILSFMPDAHLSSFAGNSYISPKPFLRADILYHLLACIMLLMLLRALEVNPVPSLLLTLLFAVHPILLQAIAWIPGRNDSLVTLFIVTAMLMQVKYMQQKKRLFILWHYLFFTLALFTKENAVLLPVLVFFYLRYINKKPVKWKEYALCGAGYAVIIGIWLFMRQQALATNAPAVSLNTGIKNLLVNAPMFLQYIGKSLIPYHLSVMSTVQDTNYVTGILAVILIAAGVVFSKEKKKALVAFGLIWFVIFLTPTFLTLSAGLEHRDYLPLAGLVIAASQVDAVKKLQFRFSPASNRNTLLIMLAVIALFAGITWLREPVFKNPVNFDKSAIATSPHSVLPCLYLAKHYEEAHEYRKAIAAYHTALKREPNGYMIHNSIGGDYIALGNYPAAEAELKKELALYPANELAVFNLGLIYFIYRKDSAAVSQWKQAIQIAPGFMNSYKMLAAYYLQLHDSSAAMPYLLWLKNNGYPLPH